MMKKKKLAVIGCGIAAIPILNKAKQMDVETHCFALSKNSLTEGLYDYYYEVDYLDIELLLEKCREVCVDGIIATSENTTASVARLTSLIGLPGNRFEGAFIGGDKYLQRQALQNAIFVKQPKFGYLGEVSIPLPVVVKATDSSGKKGISLATTNEELQKSIEYAKSASCNGKVLIEEYLTGGIEYSIECLSYLGKHLIIQTTQKDTSGPPHFVELGHHQPGKLQDISFEQLQKAVVEILDAIGIINSISHLEVKIIDGNIYFIELGARAGGDRIADTLVALSTDFDYFKGAIEVALGDFSTSNVRSTMFAGIYFLCNQTAFLKPLFDYANGKEWCKELFLPNNDLKDKNGNDDGNTSGYFIYQADHKITLRDVSFEAVRINKYPNVLDLLVRFNEKINRQIDKIDLIKGMQRFLDNGNVIAVMYDNEIIAMLNVYCNFHETKDAYINNVEVLPEYQGVGLSKLLMKKSFQVIKENAFQSVSLHVTQNNIKAVELYKKFDFAFTGDQKFENNNVLYEMKKVL